MIWTEWNSFLGKGVNHVIDDPIPFPGEVTG